MDVTQHKRTCFYSLETAPSILQRTSPCIYFRISFHNPCHLKRSKGALKSCSPCWTPSRFLDHRTAFAALLVRASFSKILAHFGKLLHLLLHLHGCSLRILLCLCCFPPTLPFRFTVLIFIPLPSNPWNDQRCRGILRSYSCRRS